MSELSLEKSAISINSGLEKNIKVLQALILPLAFIALWAVASALQWLDAKLIPSPLTVFNGAIQSFSQAEFWQGFVASLSRNFTGYAIGASLGVAFGVALGQKFCLSAFLCSIPWHCIAWKA